ncbi:Diaminopimelate epimerase [Desulfurella amilsii]|uniref:Diaminopimelate epimerase n=1 Tax=Desulfurella amilsii TaxID=1562698 RepID=A0A1X4XXV8_9BACT|nr:diaminopimelate epimerase [Desulfurella amilsii]OSS42376.1 Diaminopimelate epimerase [Desulfurella amilsii]
MRKIEFFKMNGSGNDFILIDNREKIVENIGLKIEDFVKNICKRGLSIGADGVILIENTDEPGCDFAWRFFNSDGSQAPMCGNGSRCAVRFAYLKGIISDTKTTFLTGAGKIYGEIVGINTVKVQLTKPTDYKTINLDNQTMYFINTGVPHLVIFVDDLGSVDVAGLGAKYRYHDVFAPAGANVDFVNVLDNNTIAIRTYERGVEAETLACGTGATASGLISGLVRDIQTPIEVQTRSGKMLKVYFQINNAQSHEPIDIVFLEGDSMLSFVGTMIDEAWDY